MARPGGPETHLPPSPLRLHEAGILRGHPWEVFHVRFSPNGLLLASVAESDVIQVWDIPGRKLVRVLGEAGREVVGLAFSASGHFLAAAYAEGMVQLWTQDGEPVATLPGHQDGAVGLAFLPTRDLVITVDGKNQVRIWNSVTGSVLSSFPAVTSEHSETRAHPAVEREGPDFIGPNGTLALSPATTHFSVLQHARSGAVQIWRLTLPSFSAEWITTLLDREALTGQAIFSPQGKLFAVILHEQTSDDQVHMYDGRTFTLLGRLNSASAGVRLREIEQICFSPDEQLLAVLHSDGILAIWEVVHRFRLLCWFVVHPGNDAAPFSGARSLDWSQDGKLLATGGWDPVSAGAWSKRDFVIKLWEVERRA
jgi:WD40 repeat protein